MSGFTLCIEFKLCELHDKYELTCTLLTDYLSFIESKILTFNQQSYETLKARVMRQPPPPPGGRDFHMKEAGMLVLSLMIVNFRFWSRLGCSGQNTIIFSCKGLIWDCTRRNIKKSCIFQFILFTRFM